MTSANLTELLIKKIKQHRILYDSRSPDYKNIRKKDEVWDNLGRELHISGEVLKNKWRNLRDTYGKHLKSVSPTAGPNVKKSYKHWQWANHMEYFKPFLSYAYINTAAASTPITPPVIVEPDIINDVESENGNTAMGYDYYGGEYSEFSMDSSSHFGVASSGGGGTAGGGGGGIAGGGVAGGGNGSAVQSTSSIIEQEIDFLPIFCKPKKEKDYTNRMIIQPSIDECLQQHYYNSKEEVNSYNGDRRLKNLDLDGIELILLGYAKTIKTFSPRRQARMKMKLAQIITEEEENDEEEYHQVHELSWPYFSGPSSYGGGGGDPCEVQIPGAGSGSPSSPGSVPIASKKLSSIVPSSTTLPLTPPAVQSVPPPPPPEVCLRWNSYHSNMQATFPTLLNNEQFVDVTLACEGRSIKCHKVMLSACSSYFEELLSQNPCQHPIVFMRDLKFWEVQALVEFMYSGEVNVAQEKLPSLLAAAEALQIKGLTGPTQSSCPQDESDYMQSLHDSEDMQMREASHNKRVRKRKSTNPMSYPSRQPPQQSPKQMPMMHPISSSSGSQRSTTSPIPSSTTGGGLHPISSPNRKESSSSYHLPVKIKKDRESTPPLALIKEEPLDLGKDSSETRSNNGQDLSNSSSYQASNYDRSHYSGRNGSSGGGGGSLSGKPQNGLSDEEDRSSTHSNQSDETKSPTDALKLDTGDDVSDA